MEKYASVLKLIALILAAVAVVCILAANIEAIMDTLDSLCGKAKGRLCRSCAWGDDEYEDWDDEDEWEDWDD